MKSNRNTSKSLDKFHSENLSEKTFNTVLITGVNSIVAKDLINFFLKENFKVIAVYRKKFIKKNWNKNFIVKNFNFFKPIKINGKLIT